jgi:hypothetical protein
VKFSDTFSLILRYCLVQTSTTTTYLCVTAQILYHKSVNGFIKRSFDFFEEFLESIYLIEIIERNAFSASQEGLKDLSKKIQRFNEKINELFIIDNRLILLAEFQMSKIIK